MNEKTEVTKREKLSQVIRSFIAKDANVPPHSITEATRVYDLFDDEVEAGISVNNLVQHGFMGNGDFIWGHDVTIKYLLDWSDRVIKELPTPIETIRSNLLKEGYLVE